MPNPTVPETLTTQAKGALLDYAERALRQGLSDSYRSLADLPGLLADPNPPSPTFVLAKALSRQACRRWARGDTVVRGPGFDAGWGAVCGEYLDTINEDPVNGALAPPFTGGQCTGQFYRATGTISWKIYNGTTGNTSTTIESISTDLAYRGPISGVTVVYSNPGPNGPRDWALFAVTSLGNQLISDESNPITLNSVNSVKFSGGFTVSGGGDGGCGDPEPLYLPPTTPTGLPDLEPVSVTLPGIGPVDVDISFDGDGNIIVQIPDLGIEVTSPNPFGPDDGGGGGGGAAAPPGFQGDPGASQDVLGEPAEGDDPDKYLVGVKVELIDVPPRSNVRFTPSSNYVSGMYYVYLGGDEGLEQVNAAIVADSQFYYAAENANRYRVDPGVNVAIRVTPYWRANA